MFAVYRSRQVSSPGLGQSLSGDSSLPQREGACVCVRESGREGREGKERRGEAEGLEPGDMAAGHRKGSSGMKSVTQQNLGYHESSGWRGSRTADGK